MRIVGIGCRKDAPIEALRDALQRTGASGTVQAIATIPARETEVSALARDLQLPLYLVEVAGIDTPTASPRVKALRNTGSVAEAAALSALLLYQNIPGSGAAPRKITRPRVTSICGRATAAIAESEGTP